MTDPEARARRLRRVTQLRSSGAPAWVVRSEQVALVLVRRGLKVAGVGRPMSRAQDELYSRYVRPLLAGE